MGSQRSGQSDHTQPTPSRKKYLIQTIKEKEEEHNLDPRCIRTQFTGVSDSDSDNSKKKKRRRIKKHKKDQLKKLFLIQQDSIAQQSSIKAKINENFFEESCFGSEAQENDPAKRDLLQELDQQSLKQKTLLTEDNSSMSQCTSSVFFEDRQSKRKARLNKMRQMSDAQYSNKQEMDKIVPRRDQSIELEKADSQVVQEDTAKDTLKQAQHMLIQ